MVPAGLREHVLPSPALRPWYHWWWIKERIRANGGQEDGVPTSAGSPGSGQGRRTGARSEEEGPTLPLQSLSSSPSAAWHWLPEPEQGAWPGLFPPHRGL